MSPLSLEQRVAALEHELAESKAQRGSGPPKDFRRTVGRFTDHPGRKESSPGRTGAVSVKRILVLFVLVGIQAG
jgi:hypothetical protein